MRRDLAVVVELRVININGGIAHLLFDLDGVPDDHVCVSDIPQVIDYVRIVEIYLYLVVREGINSHIIRVFISPDVDI